MGDLVITQKENLVSIADAIREKTGLEDGMSFPDGFLEAVEGISAGYPVAYGTFSLASATKDYVVTHNLGVVPNVVFYWMQKKHNRYNVCYYECIARQDDIPYYS